MNYKDCPKEEKGVLINLSERREIREKSSLFSGNEGGDALHKDEPMLLHMELTNERCSDDEKKLLMKYSYSTKRGTITRTVNFGDLTGRHGRFCRFSIQHICIKRHGGKTGLLAVGQEFGMEQ